MGKALRAGRVIGTSAESATVHSLSQKAFAPWLCPVLCVPYASRLFPFSAFVEFMCVIAVRVR